MQTENGIFENIIKIPNTCLVNCKLAVGFALLNEKDAFACMYKSEWEEYT
jgi:hypothetical protein